ncbi:hypothetical protein M951_chr3160 (nucleomorph) [Lotharella oceanica]|uniref:Uncharacterized protein n=1 Tax=Lotharella oceanica TaxID=641309 RepID=A0A060DG42_9EUKA|nr:hypothetical protein M951_chr145 [Lotharella oceanica]AIB09665.1 hypothetical protein M951_chr1186 [Lotharella oceanica]AIB09748.1 hypothetical protein M951_chr245 [Lotharella oceanica]AIB09868.1 hypothetical protein M951_chr2176 [Lotharella oceanica]AIB09951.1 hypothetical protein M951_chr345 [Lotharella oceanica]
MDENTLDVQAVINIAFALIISGNVNDQCHSGLTGAQQALVVDVWTVLYLLTQMNQNMNKNYAADEIENVNNVLDFVGRILSGMQLPVMNIMKSHSILKTNGTISLIITCVLGEIFKIMDVKKQVLNILRNAAHYACVRMKRINTMDKDMRTTPSLCVNGTESDAKLFVEGVLRNEEEVVALSSKQRGCPNA